MDKIAIVLVIFSVLSGCGGIQATRAQPNILLVVLDTVRADHVGCYGYDRNTTPNIDAFAREAVVYRNAYATCSWTLPACTSLLTGLDCETHGVTGQNKVLDSETPYLPDNLTGYVCGAFINNPSFLTKGTGYARGFDEFWHAELSSENLEELLTQGAIDPDDSVVVNRAIPWLRSTTQPWFAYVHMIGPHTPYRAPVEPEQFGTDDVDLYDGKLRYADRELGRLLAEVPPDTVVIITSDHGEEFGEHGGKFHGRELHDELLRVPLIIRMPGVVPRREWGIVGLDRVAPAVLSGELPETGGTVRADLEVRTLAGKLKYERHRVITNADIPGPVSLPENAHVEQLKALGYLGD